MHSERDLAASVAARAHGDRKRASFCSVDTFCANAQSTKPWFVTFSAYWILRERRAKELAVSRLPFRRIELKAAGHVSAQVAPVQFDPLQMSTVWSLSGEKRTLNKPRSTGPIYDYTS